MEITIIGALTAMPLAVANHKGKQASFQIKPLGNKNTAVDYDIFEYINLYWSQQPEARQDEIFEIYVDIERCFGDTMGRDDLAENLMVKIAALTSYHNLQQISDWISFRTDAMMPTDLKDEFTDNIDDNDTREKTYTKRDYVQLRALSLGLRCAVPIWGEYISNVRSEYGNDFKEYFAFQLLNRSEYMNSAAIEKLRVYIEHIIGPDKNTRRSNLDGVSSEDYGFWLLAMTVIRRVCIGDIRGLPDKPHLIKTVYKFLFQQIHNTENNPANAIKPKTVENSGKEGENKISTLERYKIKTNISIGTIVELENCVKDMGSVAMRLTGQLNPELLYRSFETASVLQDAIIPKAQMTLLQMVFKPVIPADGPPYLSKQTIVAALAALEAVLWARGHKYLALLASAQVIVIEGSHVVATKPSNKRSTDEYVQQIEALYPHARPGGSRKANVQPTNLVVESIDLLSKSFSNNTWKATAHESMIEEVLGNTNRRIPMKSDICNHISSLVIELGQRSWL